VDFGSPWSPSHEHVIGKTRRLGLANFTSLSECLCAAHDLAVSYAGCVAHAFMERNGV